MTSPELTVRLGDVFLRLTGWLPSDDGYLYRFAAQGEPDISCHILRCERLDAPCAPALYTAPRKAVWRTAQEETVAYFTDTAHRKCYALLSRPCASAQPLTLRLCAPRIRYQEKYVLSCICVESLLLQHREAIFHAAWIEREGKAVLFSGASGAGKSTHSALWAQLRHTPVVNGDKALLLRREDGFYAAGLPYAGSSGICRNVTLPLDTLVFLSHGKENGLRRLGAREAVSMLLSQMPVQSWRAEDIDAALHMATQLAAALPIYAYACLPDASAVTCLEQRLFREDA